MVAMQSFGAGAAVDAFLVAFKIPNFLRRLFAEGAFSQAFVPVLAEYTQEKTVSEVRSFVAHMAGTLGIVLLLVTIVVELATPLLVLVFAPGFWGDTLRLGLTTEMLRITFPYLMMISLTAFASAVLNTYGRFGVPAFTPVLLNLCLIGAALWLAPNMAYPVESLAWGVFIAGIVQLLFQLPFLYRLRLLPLPRINFADPGVRRVLTLMLPALFGVSVVQLNLLLDTLFSSFLPPGSISWLYISDRITSLPLGVFGVAIASVLLPYLSRQSTNPSTKPYSKVLDWGIRCVLLIGIPSAISLIVLAGPVLTTLMQYGKFSPVDVIMARKSMIAFSVGIPFFMLVKVLAAGFYARQDIRRPVKIAIIAIIANTLSNCILIVFLDHAALALSTSLSSLLNAGLLFYGLRQCHGFQLSKGWIKYALQLLFANTTIVVVLFWLNAPLEDWLSWGASARSLHLGLLITAAIVAYVVALYISGVRVKDFRMDGTVIKCGKVSKDKVLS
jgi:putative peptidoglycan lipid II flippase